MIEERRLKICSTGWRLGRINERAALIDKSTGEELSDGKFVEIEARVEANMVIVREEAGDTVLGQRSAVRSEAPL
jgi:hypothetical protein